MSATEIRSLNGYKLNDETARSNIEKLRTESQQYTNTKISQLINSAPTTLDTLGEIAAAMAENATVVEALDAAIGSKADKNYVDEAIANLPKGEPDWNAKSGEEGYIKNRTHYEVEKTIELLPITTVVSDAPSAIADFTEDWNDDQFVALGNSKIYTTFDGKTYTYDSGLDYLETGGSSTTIMLGGNPYLFNNYLTDNGLPFFVGLMPISRRFIAKWPQDGNEHTFSIKYGSGEYDVHQLDPKFIPTATNEEVYAMMLEEGALPIIQTEDGAVLTIAENEILMI